MLYKVFIDDSGAKEYVNPYVYAEIDKPLPYEGNEKYWRDNYFVLAGIRVKSQDLGEIDAAFRELKIKYFGTDIVEVKSDWLRNEYQRDKHYIKSFGITKDKLNEFGNKYTDLIARYKDSLVLFGVVFDKRYYKYRDKPCNDPLLFSTQVFLEKIQKSGKYNILVIDQMDTSTSKFRGLNGKILDVYMANKDMERIYIKDYDNIIDCTFGDSSKDNFLQIADVCAYNIYRQFVMYGPDYLKQRGNDKLPVYEYFNRICQNFFESPYHPIAVVNGYGLVYLPNKVKVNWLVKS